MICDCSGVFFGHYLILETRSNAVSRQDDQVAGAMGKARSLQGRQAVAYDSGPKKQSVGGRPAGRIRSEESSLDIASPCPRQLS